MINDDCTSYYLNALFFYVAWNNTVADDTCTENTPRLLINFLLYSLLYQMCFVITQIYIFLLWKV